MSTPPTITRPPPGTPKNQAKVDPNLFGTPHSLGTSLLGVFARDKPVRQLTPWMRRDIAAQETCTFDEMLSYLLQQCLPADKRDNPPAGLLHACLQKVLPICNRQVNPLDIPDVKCPSVREHLADYCTISLPQKPTKNKPKEEPRYAPFVQLCNTALGELKHLDCPLRPYDDSGPEILITRHENRVPGGSQFPSKPDLMHVFLKAMCNSFGSLDWFDAAKIAYKPMKKSLPWTATAGSQELKARAQIKMDRTKEYVVKTLEQVAPIILTSVKSSTEPEAEEEVATSRSIVSELRGELRMRRHAPEEDSADGTKSLPTPYEFGVGAAFDHSRSSGWKRALSDMSEEGAEDTSRKRAKIPTQLENQAIEQCSRYAGERLYAVPLLSHVMNLIIIDAVVWILWYDRQGVIQSGGVNFVNDLPRLVVLLLAFQRLSRRDWGEICPSPTDSIDLGAVTINIDHEKKCVFKQFGLAGRGTYIVEATSASADPRDPIRPLADGTLIAKFCWPEHHRNEASVLVEAAAIASRFPQVHGHVPELLHSYDFPNVNTQRVRTAFIATNTHYRLFRVLLFRPLKRITELSGKRFWVAFQHCFDCHYYLWKEGVHHHDISANNLMWRDGPDGEPIGVLNDFDLARFGKNSDKIGIQRTGTLPFLTLEFLTTEAGNRSLEHRYRHDAESFIWVLVWIAARFDKGKELRPPPLQGWITSDLNGLAGMKCNILQSPKNSVGSTPSHRTASLRCVRALYVIAEIQYQIVQAERRGVSFDEWENKDVYKQISAAFASVPDQDEEHEEREEDVFQY